MSKSKISDFLNSLQDFKNKDLSKLRKECEKKYGKDIYFRYISVLLDDLEENLECHIEELAEETVIENEIYYYTEEITDANEDPNELVE